VQTEIFRNSVLTDIGGAVLEFIFMLFFLITVQ